MESLHSQLGGLQYDDAPESAAIAKIQSDYGLFINGKFTSPKDHKSFFTTNPATEEKLAKI